MSDKDLIGITPMDDNVTFYAADEARLRSYQEASEALFENCGIPILEDGNCLFYALG